MIKVVFVGDAPSRSNLDKDIAFIGAKCFPTLVEWISRVSPTYYVCLNSNTKANMGKIYKLYKENFKVIALGNVASQRLEAKRISHFKLPHPSGLNRQTNDLVFIGKELNKAYDYVRGILRIDLDMQGIETDSVSYASLLPNGGQKYGGYKRMGRTILVTKPKDGSFPVGIVPDRNQPSFILNTFFDSDGVEWATERHVVVGWGWLPPTGVDKGSVK